MKLKAIGILCLLLAVWTVSPALAAEYAVVVHKESKVKRLSAAELKKIFRGELLTWPAGMDGSEGEKIKVTAQRGGKGHKAFLKEIVDMSPREFALYWKRITFTGSGTPVKILKNNEKVKAFIRQNPEAIGYIDAAAMDDTVKKIVVSRY